MKKIEQKEPVNQNRIGASGNRDIFTDKARSLIIDRIGYYIHDLHYYQAISIAGDLAFLDLFHQNDDNRYNEQTWRSIEGHLNDLKEIELGDMISLRLGLPSSI